MPIAGKWIFTVSMDVSPDKEALFNEVYDQEHIPLITKVPGVISATRARLDTLRLTMGGRPRLSIRKARRAMLPSMSLPARMCS